MFDEIFESINDLSSIIIVYHQVHGNILSEPWFTATECQIFKKKACLLEIGIFIQDGVFSCNTDIVTTHCTKNGHQLLKLNISKIVDKDILLFRRKSKDKKSVTKTSNQYKVF